MKKMKIEKTIKSSFDRKKTLEILDDYFVSIGYKKTGNEVTLVYERGSFIGSLFSSSPKSWKSIIRISISGRENNVTVELNANINTTGQMVVKRERDFLENEFEQIESMLLDLSKDEYDKYKHNNNFSTPVNKKTIYKINDKKIILFLLILMGFLAMVFSFQDSLVLSLTVLMMIGVVLLFLFIEKNNISSLEKLEMVITGNKHKTEEKFLNLREKEIQQKDTMISLSEFPRLKVAALIFIALGVAEVLFIINSLTSGQSFATSFIFVFYAFVGFKLLLLKKGIKLKTYKDIRNLISFIFVFAVASILLEIIDLTFFFSVKSILLEYNMKDLGNFFIPAFFIPHLILVCLLNRPIIKQRELLLKPIKQSLFVLGVALALLIMGVMSGPHLIKNHFQSIADAAIADQQIKKDVGEIEKLVLNKKEGTFNWVFFSEWDIIGSKCRGTYGMEVSSKNEVTFQIKKLQCPEDDQQKQNREYIPSLIKDISVKQSPEPTSGILLSTSFENLDSSNPEVVTPFINAGKTKWQIYTKDSKTGKYSLNVLPDGNFPEGFSGLFSDFTDRNENVSVLNSVFSNKYEPFDVSDYDRVEFEFWRYSASNPRKKDDWNCAGNLDLKYRTDKGEWKTAMCFCGEHRLETRGWRFSSLTFDTKEKSTIEFKFEYDSFLIREEDSTAFYLIDDLQVKGFKGEPF